MLQRENLEETDVDAFITPECLPELLDLTTTESETERPPRVVGNRQSARKQEETSLDAEDDIADDSCQWLQCCPEWSGPVMKIVDWRAVEDAFEYRNARADFNEQRRLNALMRTLRSRGEYRKLMPIPADWRAQLTRMARDFPNFEEVIEYLRVMYALSEHRDRVVRFDPMLLNGEPGCGKSYFAECLGQAIGAGTYTVHMETAQSNSVLSGSADYWSNSKSGMAFNYLVEKDFANPCFVIDEVEKCTSRDFDPLMSLLTLLEPGTARRYSDMSYPWLQLDASAMLWVCTGNTAELLPLPVLDRLRRFDIGLPTERETQSLVQRMFRELLVDLSPDAGAIRLSGSAIDEVIGLAPRRLKRVLREAIGRALYESRKTVLARDIVVESDDEYVAKVPMGFV